MNGVSCWHPNRLANLHPAKAQFNVTHLSDCKHDRIIFNGVGLHSVAILVIHFVVDFPTENVRNPK